MAGDNLALKEVNEWQPWAKVFTGSIIFLVYIRGFQTGMGLAKCLLVVFQG
ncbi:MAG TPA: hypothetical protein VHK67_01760 [Rhabdochlamydiaceae bacterium]|nr:hypothetical protein [Rhabdochlamydiaceae bacterium]